MSKKRRFGRVRQLSSGRWQARYAGPDGIDRPADETFASKADAEVWLTLKEAEIRSGDWINPDEGKVAFADYARTWIEERPGLRPKTVELYRYLLRKHMAPALGQLAIADIQPSHVRRWRKQLLDAGVSAVTVGQGVPAAQGDSQHGRRRWGDHDATRAGSRAPGRRSHPSGRP